MTKVANKQQIEICKRAAVERFRQHGVNEKTASDLFDMTFATLEKLAYKPLFQSRVKGRLARQALKSQPPISSAVTPSLPAQSASVADPYHAAGHRGAELSNWLRKEFPGAKQTPIRPPVTPSLPTQLASVADPYHADGHRGVELSNWLRKEFPETKQTPISSPGAHQQVTTALYPSSLGPPNATQLAATLRRKARDRVQPAQLAMRNLYNN